MSFNPQVISFFNQLIKEDMQQISGGTDSLMGQPQYSNMSAAQTGMLQAAGATYTKRDDVGYTNYLESVYTCGMIQIAEYKTFEHNIKGVDEAGNSTTITANPGGISDWDWRRYHVVPHIQNNPEAIKQLREQRAMNLKGMGAMSLRRMLAELGYANAEQIAQEVESENQVLAIAKMLSENPQMLQAFEEQITNGASNAPGNSPGGNDVKN